MVIRLITSVELSYRMSSVHLNGYSRAEKTRLREQESHSCDTWMTMFYDDNHIVRMMAGMTTHAHTDMFHAHDDDDEASPPSLTGALSPW